MAGAVVARTDAHGEVIVTGDGVLSRVLTSRAG
jgi:hypothetical protein